MEQKKRRKRSFTLEFKQEAVELAKRTGTRKAARELGIHESNLRSWRRIMESGPGPGFHDGRFPGKSCAELQKEIRRLTRENGYLKEINRVLKKSTAIFSRNLMGGLK